MTPDTNSIRLVGPEPDVGGSTVGADLLLNERPDGSLELYTFDGRDARALGTFPDAAAAWRAIDAIDDEALADGELAA
jgi:hypothetical protein